MTSINTSDAEGKSGAPPLSHFGRLHVTEGVSVACPQHSRFSFEEPCHLFLCSFAHNICDMR